MFLELYFLRWPIESKYMELKERFLLEVVSEAFKVRSQIQPGRKFRRKNTKLVCRKHFSNLKTAY